jgi:uncharacterized protein (TIGR02246 family)
MTGKPIVDAILLLVLTSGLGVAQDNKQPAGGARAGGGEKSPAKGASAAPLNTRGQAADNANQAKVQQAPVTSDPRAEDRVAIRYAMQSFVKAFEERDAQAVAAHWTDEGEYQDSAGAQLRGREALQQAFAEFFAKTPEVKSEVRPQVLRFTSRDSAIEEGKVRVRRGPAATATAANYTALFVREDQGWRIALLSETPTADDVSIEDLNWLIGQWKSSTGEGAEIRTTYRWDPAKKFIYMQFTITEPALSLTGTQVIGLDPATFAIHSWTFEASGGVGEATWHRDGDHWVLDAAGTLPDGSSLTETNVLRRVNEDTFTWQSVNRMLGDVPLADLAPVKVARVKTEK